MIVTDKIDTNEQIEAANSVNAPTVEDKSRDVSELVKTTFFFEMTFNNIGESRNAPGAEQNIETTANKKMLKVLKRLFVSPQLAKIKSQDAKLKRKINKLTVRGGLLTVRTIPKRHARNVIAMCAEHELTRNSLVDAFALVYPSLYENAKAELGPMFKSEEYPAPFKQDGTPDTESVKSAFKFTYNFVTYGVPEELKEFDGEGYRAQVSKREAIYKTAAEEINRTRRAMFSALLGKLQAELAPGETGDKKKFSSRAMVKMQKFLEEYDMLNVTNDAELAELKTKTAQLISGITADNIKSSEDFKSTLYQQINEIGASLKPLVEGEGTRALKVVQ
jgi:hypothetical protein